LTERTILLKNLKI